MVEAAARGGGGISIDVDRVPARTTGLTPYEIMLSESQERMLAIVERGHEDRVLDVFRRWGLHSETIGEVTSSGTLQVRSAGELEAELPIEALVEAPTYTFPVERPAYLDEVQRLDSDTIAQPDDLAATFLDLLASPNIASRAPVFRRYDHMVGTNTVVQPGGDAAVLRIKGTSRGIAISTDGNGRLCYLDPREGGKIVVAEAARNVSCVGATPIALTDCLNFGSPEVSAVYFQLAEVIEGMAEACRVFDVPVVSGNVSLYNESGGRPIWPTPVVGMLGLLDRLERRCDIGFGDSGDVVALLGDTEADLAGSEYLQHVHGLTAGRPSIDLGRELAVQRLVRESIAEGLLRSAHDCSDGGLGVTIAESAFRSDVGVDCPSLGADTLRPDAALFAETQSRVVVSVAASAWPDLEQRARDTGVPCHRLGVVGGDRLTIGPLDVSLDDARTAWSNGLVDALRSAA
jgi:phosphoribosylformylglycinamidine synthase